MWLDSALPAAPARFAQTASIHVHGWLRAVPGPLRNVRRRVGATASADQRLCITIYLSLQSKKQSQNERTSSLSRRQRIRQLGWRVEIPFIVLFQFALKAATCRGAGVGMPLAFFTTVCQLRCLSTSQELRSSKQQCCSHLNAGILRSASCVGAVLGHCIRRACVPCHGPFVVQFRLRRPCPHYRVLPFHQVTAARRRRLTRLAKRNL